MDYTFFSSVSFYLKSDVIHQNQSVASNLIHLASFTGFLNPVSLNNQGIRII